jgi:hypothetical protein
VLLAGALRAGAGARDDRRHGVTHTFLAPTALKMMARLHSPSAGRHAPQVIASGEIRSPPRSCAGAEGRWAPP